MSNQSRTIKSNNKPYLKNCPNLTSEQAVTLTFKLDRVPAF